MAILLQKFDDEFGILADVLFVSVISVDENHQVSGVATHLGSLVIAGWSSHTTYLVTVNRQTFDVDHASADAFVWFAGFAYAQGMPNERIPLSEKGKALAVSKRNIFSNVDRCFSSPYRRAMETAEFIADHPVIVKELHERTIGDAREDFWLKQYEDHDFRNPGGESLNQVKVRTLMDPVKRSVLSR